MYSDLQKLFSSRVIVRVPPPEIGSGHYSSFFNSKIVRRIPNDNKFETSKYVRKVQKIQDGVYKINYPSDKQRLGDVHSRPEECVLSGSNTSLISGSAEVLGEISGPNLPLPISVPSLWPSIGSKDFHEAGSRGGGLPKKPRHNDSSILGRFSRGGKNRRYSAKTQRSSHNGFGAPRMGSKPGKVTSKARIPENISGSTLGLYSQTILFARSLAAFNEEVGVRVPKGSGYSKICHENVGEDDSLHPLCQVGSGTLKTTTGTSSQNMGPSSFFPGQKASSINRRKKITTMVDSRLQPKSRCAMDRNPLRGYHHGRRSVVMGSTLGRKILSGRVAKENQSDVIKLQRIVRSLGGPQKKPSPPKKQTRKNSIGQCDSSILFETPGRLQTQGSSRSSSKDFCLVRKHNPVNNSSTSRGISKHSGRLPEQKKGVSNRMGIKSEHFSNAMPPLGNSWHRLVRYKEKFEGAKILFPQPFRYPGSSRRTESEVGRTSILCVPSNSTYPSSAQKDPRGPSNSDNNSAILAKKKLVPIVRVFQHHGSYQSPVMEGHHSSRTGVTPRSREITSISMDPERDMLKARGLSDKVISTIQASRKPVTAAIYHKIWKKFCTESGRSAGIPGALDVPRVLNFLQSGFDMGIRPSTLKVQISALSTFLDYPLASHPWIIRFVKAIQKLRPTLRQLVPSWDLNLVLRALCKDPYTLREDMPISVRTWKTAFLVAITTAKRVGEIQALSIKDPYLQVREDHIILKLDPAFVPKVASFKNRDQEIILPSFCDNPSNEKEQALHSLDVRQAVLDYLEATSSWRKDSNLFILFGGKNRGKKASKTSIARWITSIISKAYTSEGIDCAVGIKAHSTRAVSASWAERVGASLDQICKAATWARVNTFCKHYKLDVLAAHQTSFGRKVLQAVVPP
ncbi:uncharacterized protein LOC143804593 [Ranitomeya variabilis]|uniref:uncharacterized protein LOC143804593 n=1 Tax=Ranitomeya variabilis TaxID=490064 RepID=UPI004057A2F0